MEKKNFFFWVLTAHMWKGVEGCGRVWKDIEGYGRVWNDVEGY